METRRVRRDRRWWSSCQVRTGTGNESVGCGLLESVVGPDLYGVIGGWNATAETRREKNKNDGAES